jgi:hypothetical protein
MRMTNGGGDGGPESTTKTPRWARQRMTKDEARDPDSIQRPEARSQGARRRERKADWYLRNLRNLWIILSVSAILDSGIWFLNCPCHD